MISSEQGVPVPTRDIVSWTFNECPTVSRDETHPIWVDAYDTSRYLDYKTAKAMMRKTVCGLRRCGLQPGDVVCVHSFNNIWYPALYLGVIGAGGIFIGSNPAYKPTELEHLFVSSRARFFIVESAQAGHVLVVAARVGINSSRTFILDEEDDNGTHVDSNIPAASEVKSWRRDLLSHGEDDWVTFDDERLSERTPAVYLSSSGTTGMPKIVIMSHGAIIAQLALANYQASATPHTIRRLITLPLFHSFALPFPALSMHRRETLVIMSRFDLVACTDAINRHHITMMPVVPPIAKALLTQSNDCLTNIASLTEMICAGAPLDGITQRKLSRRLGSSARFVQLWGMTELGWVTAFTHPDHDDMASDGPASVGRLLPGISAKVIPSDDEQHDTNNDNDNEPTTRPGEIYVRSPGVMLGYLDNATATAETLSADGWLRTGDIGYCSGGKWYIVDRAKDIIKVLGWQVSPTEVEACLLQHPSVVDAAVIDMSDEMSDEKPMAFIVAVDGGEDTTALAEGIKVFVARNLASYKALDGGVVFVAQIPRAVSGKILRRLTREQVRDAVQ